MKKFFTIFFIILVIFTIFYLVWFFFFKTPNQVFPFIPNGNSLTVGGNILNSKNIKQNTNINQDNSATQTNENINKQYLFQIWDKPTAGFTFIQNPILLNATTTNKKGVEIVIQKRATTTSLIFADRMTGHIYKKDLGAGEGVDARKQQSKGAEKFGEIYKVSNSTIPGVYDAYFFENGYYVLMRYLDNKTNKIESILAKIPQTYSRSEPQVLENLISLPQDIYSVAISRSGKEISYLVPSTSGAVVYSYSLKKGVLTARNRANLKTNEWNLVYGGENLYAQSSPSAYVSGYFIKIDNNERILGDKTGLTVLPDDKDLNYFGSMWTNSGLASFIFSRNTGLMNKTNQATLSEKCVWMYSNKNILCATPNSLPWAINGMPDDWYQGRASFADSFYVLSSDGLYDNMFLDLSTVSGKDIDAVSLQTDKTSEFLGFINKKEGDFWLLLTKDILNNTGLGL